MRKDNKRRLFYEKNDLYGTGAYDVCINFGVGGNKAFVKGRYTAFG